MSGNIPRMDTGNELAGIAALFQTLAGKTSTRTASEGISQEGLNAALKSILESTNGLAAVSSGQRSAGLYDSSTATLLANDLMTRAAGQVAANNKTVTVKDKQNPAVDPALLVAGLLALPLLSPAASRGGKKLGTLGDDLADVIFGSTGSGGKSTKGSTFSAGGSAVDFMSNAFGGAVEQAVPSIISMALGKNTSPAITFSTGESRAQYGGGGFDSNQGSTIGGGNNIREAVNSFVSSIFGNSFRF